MFPFRHPPGLAVLFLTELWERFSFYTMAALFMLYMTDRDQPHALLRDHASLINGAYFGTVYFTPLFGGLLADWRLGYRNAVALGAVVMGVGHLLLAFDQLPFFFAGLVALAAGNGLFKPNVSTLVGRLYPAGDPRIDTAFTIFYVGINVGAFLAPLAAGALRVHYGFHVAFGSAGVGMGVSLLTFVLGRRWVVAADPSPGDARPPAPSPAASGDAVTVSGSLTNRPAPAESAFPGPVVSAGPSLAVQEARNLALLIVFAVMILFWAVFNQGGNTIPLWFRDCTDRTAPAWLSDQVRLRNGEIPAEVVNALNPLYVILFSFPLAWLWLRLRGAGLEPGTPAKLCLGMVLTSVGFAGLAAGALAGADQPGVRVSPGYLLGAYAFITLGELMLSPIGLSLVSQLAPPRARSVWMGGWFAATAAGGYLSGLLGVFWDVWRHSTFFATLAGSTLAAFALLLAFYPRLRAAMPLPPKTPG